MKNVDKVVAATKKGKVPLYYNIRNDSVHTKAGKDRYFLTMLLREHSRTEVEDTVKLMMSY